MPGVDGSRPSPGYIYENDLNVLLKADLPVSMPAGAHPQGTITESREEGRASPTPLGQLVAQGPKNSTEGSSLHQQCLRGARFRWIKDRFWFSGLPGPHASQRGTLGCNPLRNSPRTPLSRGRTRLLMISPRSLLAPSSRCLTIVVVQHSAQPLADLNRSVRGT